MNPDTTKFLLLKKDIDLEEFKKLAHECGGRYTTTVEMEHFMLSFLNHSNNEIAFSKVDIRLRGSDGLNISRPDGSIFTYNAHFIHRYFDIRNYFSGKHLYKV
jgi:hypothetical protein